MMKFSKKVEYALIAMLDLSQKPSGQLTTARELSDKYSISLELMCKILQRLAKSGLVISVQGVKGGYYIGQHSDQIKVASIITAIDGPIAITDCIKTNRESECEREGNCIIRKSLEHIQSRLMNLLDEITLEDFQKTGTRLRVVGRDR